MARVDTAPATSGVRVCQPTRARARKPTHPRVHYDADASTTWTRAPERNANSVARAGEPQRSSRRCSGVDSAARSSVGWQAVREGDGVQRWPRSSELACALGYGKPEASRQRVGRPGPRRTTTLQAGSSGSIHPKRVKSAATRVRAYSRTSLERQRGPSASARRSRPPLRTQSRERERESSNARVSGTRRSGRVGGALELDVPSAPHSAGPGGGPGESTLRSFGPDLTSF
ncbi:hypothetical protein B0H10DRAFT_2241009 [Mycena sp. CBHHK59/15]|nr:hypothetical protein B0H10DRAFT_2241009 [Mycena sp. CBHHK59/15]